MLSQEETVLLNHLRITEEKAREMQKEARYKHLIDCLAGACLVKDQANFQKLLDRIRNKFSALKEFQESWSFLEQLEQAVKDLEKQSWEALWPSSTIPPTNKSKK